MRGRPVYYAALSISSSVDPAFRAFPLKAGSTDKGFKVLSFYEKGDNSNFCTELNVWIVQISAFVSFQV